MHLLSTNGFANNVIACVVIWKETQCWHWRIGKDVFYQQLRFRKSPCQWRKISKKSHFVNVFGSLYDFPYGISTFLTLVSLSYRKHIFLGFKLILQKYLSRKSWFPVFNKCWELSSSHKTVGLWLLPYQMYNSLKRFNFSRG